ncbi:nucleotidyltransferase [Candidatus Poribacteria bacterium]|nr:nucleotidyltransferase [Candidatus Poribacteria bacterium]
MPRERTVKLPPRKRGGKLTVHQIRRAVDKVIRERIERGTGEVPTLTYPAQASPLLDAIADALDISENHYTQVVKLYESLGTWLERDESKVACYSPEIYPQGSFALGTVTKPLSDAEEYDIDLVSELRLQKTEISQEKLKHLVGKEIKAYAHAMNMCSLPKETQHSWKLNYANGAQFHVDILPAVSNAAPFKFPSESKESSSSNRLDFEIAITDNTLPNYCQIDTNWPCSNPKGYAEWFRSRMKKRVAAIRRSLTRRQIDNVPDYRIKTPIQRAIQILKRHRDIWFDKNQSDYDEKAKPISIIITTLAAHAYYNEKDLQQTLLKILTQMPHYIAYDNNGVTLIRNPVNPLENFAAEWQEHPIRKASFMDWLKQAQLDLTEALELSNIQSVEKSLKFCLGEGVVKEGLQNLSNAEGGPYSTLAATVKIGKPYDH